MLQDCVDRRGPFSFPIARDPAMAKTSKPMKPSKPPKSGKPGKGKKGC
jgi:hypothetical protein